MLERETLGERLRRARSEKGLSVPQLVRKISEDYRFEIGETTVRDIERDKTPNPGFKTLKFISLGVGLDPLEVIKLGLDDPRELEPGYTASQFLQLARVYKQIRKDKKPFANELIQMLMEKMERWR